MSLQSFLPQIGANLIWEPFFRAEDRQRDRRATQSTLRVFKPQTESIETYWLKIQPMFKSSVENANKGIVRYKNKPPYKVYN